MSFCSAAAHKNFLGSIKNTNVWLPSRSIKSESLRKGSAV